MRAYAQRLHACGLTGPDSRHQPSHTGPKWPFVSRRTMASTSEQRDYRPFIPECVKRGIGKTKAYELANAGLLETFPIGTRRFVYIDSLLTLPQRLKEAADVAERG